MSGENESHPDIVDQANYVATAKYIRIQKEGILGSFGVEVGEGVTDEELDRLLVTTFGHDGKVDDLAEGEGRRRRFRRRGLWDPSRAVEKD